MSRYVVIVPTMEVEVQAQNEEEACEMALAEIGYSDLDVYEYVDSIGEGQ